jgi:hypothetical protein
MFGAAKGALGLFVLFGDPVAVGTAGDVLHPSLIL